MITRIRAAVALGLLAGFYLLGALTVLWFLVVVVAELHYGVTGGLFMFTLCSCLVFLWSFGAALVAARRAGREVPAGLVLTREAQPELWSTIGDLARDVGTRAPDEIRLVPEVNAGVSESTRWMGLRPGTRRMLIGVPLLLGMTRGQVLAVMTHELGHYSGRHTRLGPPIYRGGHALAQVVEHLGPESWVGRVFGLYADFYFRVASAVSRRQEVEADLTAARVAGRDTTISALRELRPLDAAWGLFLGSYVGPAHALGMRPERTAEGFLDLLEDPHRRRRLQQVREDDSEPLPSVFDSHPLTSARVRLLGRLPADPRPADEVPGFALLTDPDRTMSEFFASLYGDSSELEVTDWEDVGAALGERSTTARAGAFVDAMRHASWRAGRSLTWTDVASELRSGRGPEHAARVFEADTTADRQEVAAALVGALTCRALVESTGAHHRLDWSGLGRVADDEGRVFPTRDLARAAVQSAAGVEDLMDYMTAFGVPVDEELAGTPDDDTEPEGPVRVLGVVAPVQRGPRWVILMPCTTGLAVLRLRGLSEFWALSLTEFRAGAARRIATLLHRKPIEEVLVRPGAVLVAWDTVIRADVVERTLRRPLLTLVTSGGHRHTFKLIHQTDVSGDPWGALHHFLGDRFQVGAPSAGGPRTGSRVGVS